MSDVPYWVTSSAAVNASLKFANEIWNSFTREVLERLQLPVYLKCPRQCLETLGNCCDLKNWCSPHRWWSLQCRVSWVPCVKGCSSNAEDSSPWMTLSCIYSIVLNFILTAVMVEELSQSICLCSDFFFLLLSISITICYLKWPPANLHIWISKKKVVQRIHAQG